MIVRCGGASMPRLSTPCCASRLRPLSFATRHMADSRASAAAAVAVARPPQQQTAAAAAKAPWWQRLGRAMVLAPPRRAVPEHLLHDFRRQSVGSGITSVRSGVPDDIWSSRRRDERLPTWGEALRGSATVSIQLFVWATI